MTTHSCPRCGHEEHCGYGNWPDRHPVMAVTGGIFALVFMGMLFSVYTTGALIMTTIAAVTVGIRATARIRRTRGALIRRADYEHAMTAARSMPQPIRLPAPGPQPRPPSLLHAAATEPRGFQPPRSGRH